MLGLGLVIANYIDLKWGVACWDCDSHVGVPFTIYHEGGFVGGTGWVWSGLFGDIALCTICSFVLGFLWSQLDSYSK